MEANELDKVTELLVAEIHKLAKAGAEVGFLAANSPHIVFDEISRQSPIPLVSIVEATCQAAKALGLKRLGLLGRVSHARRVLPQSFFQSLHRFGCT